MFERYTEKARRVIFFARYEASQLGSWEITTEHVLLALLREVGPWMKLVIPELTPEWERHEIEKDAKPGGPPLTSFDMPISQTARRVLVHAEEEAERLGHKYIGCEHLLLGLGWEEESLAGRMLRQQGFDITKVREAAAYGIPGDAGREAAGHIVTKEAAYSWAATFHWEKRPCEPKDALRNLRSHRVSHYRGQTFASAQFKIVKGGWVYYRCAICTQNLYAAENPAGSIGYTNGQDWLCPSCYKRFAAPVSENEDDEA